MMVTILTVPACQSIPFDWWWQVGRSRNRSCFYWLHWGMKNFFANMCGIYYFLFMALENSHTFSWFSLIVPKYFFASKSTFSFATLEPCFDVLHLAVMLFLQIIMTLSNFQILFLSIQGNYKKNLVKVDTIFIFHTVMVIHGTVSWCKTKAIVQ